MMIVLLVVLTGVGAVAILRPATGPDLVLPRTSVPGGGSTGHVVQREWKWVRRTRVLAVVVGLLAAVAVSAVDPDGLGPVIAAIVFGWWVLVGTAIGELLIRPRRDLGIRRASVQARRIREYTPWLTAWLVAGTLVAIAVTMLFTTLTASDNNFGRSAALGCQNQTDSALTEPYPGSYYTLPLVLAVAVVVGTAFMAAIQVVRRPRGGTTSDATDDQLRRRSLDVIVAATGVALGVPLMWISTTAGSQLRELVSLPNSCASAWMNPVGWMMYVVSGVVLVITITCLLRFSDRRSLLL